MLRSPASLTDFLLRAMAQALRECPHANRIWQNDTIVQLPSVDVGLVVQVSDGLLVPVIRHADRLGLLDLVRERIKLTDAVRSGKASGDVFQGGATSLTNLGKHRVDEFAPIISPPQSSMLAVGRVAERPAAFDGKLCLRQTMHLTLFGRTTASWTAFPRRVLGSNRRSPGTPLRTAL